MVLLKVTTNNALIHFGFTHTPMCASTVYSVLSRVLLKKNHRHITRVGFEFTSFNILEQMSYQLDHRDCLVARQFESFILAEGTTFMNQCTYFR